MKKSNFICLASIFSLAFVNVSQAQIDVQSNGAVKVGNLDKTTHLSGSSLEVAVTKLFIYPTNNLKGAFTIYNNTQTPTPGGGGIIVTPSSLNEPSNNLSTYVEPYTAGKLILGTSSKPLGWVCTQGITSNSQRTTSDRRVKKDILDLPSSLAAIRDCKVKVIRDERGLAVDFEREGEYVPYGNNDDRTDAIAVEITEKFMDYLRQHETYRNAIPTQSILTITSNVVYGKKTGTTPDGRQGGTPFAPGANPMNGRDVKGAVAALSSVAKLPFHHAHDGISYTFAISPATLGKERGIQVDNLVSLLDGYFTPDGGQHLNVNVFDRELLVDAMEHPEKYPQLTIRVSGYAVNFVKLTREQQLDVLSRTINHSL